MRGLMAVAVLALNLGSSAAAMAQALAWQVTEVSGAVTIRHGSDERAATRGATLVPGDVIATGAGGRAVMVHEKDFVTLAARSRATVPGTEQQASGFTKLLQDLGNAVYKIEKRGVPHFGVTTPYLAAVVKGTTFSITVDDRGSTLQVVEGAVEVATPDGGARDLILPAGVASIAAANPYRLTVHGDHERVIDSPAGPAAKTSQAAPAAAAKPIATASAATPSAAVEPAAVGGDVIAVPVASRPVDMAAFTGGLVSGNAGFTALTAAVTDTAKAPTPVAATSHLAETAPLPVVATAATVAVTPNAAATSQPVVAVATAVSNSVPTAATGTATTVAATTAVTNATPVVAPTTTAVAAVTTPVIATPAGTTVTTPVAGATAPIVGVVTSVSTASASAVTPVTTPAAGVGLTPITTAPLAGDDGSKGNKGNDLNNKGGGSNKVAQDAAKAAKDAQKAADQAAKDAQKGNGTSSLPTASVTAVVTTVVANTSAVVTPVVSSVVTPVVTTVTGALGKGGGDQDTSGTVDPLGKIKGKLKI